MTDPRGQSWPALHGPLQLGSESFVALPKRPAGHCVRWPDLQYEPLGQSEIWIAFPSGLPDPPVSPTVNEPSGQVVGTPAPKGQYTCSLGDKKPSWLILRAQPGSWPVAASSWAHLVQVDPSQVSAHRKALADFEPSGQ